MLQVNDSHRGVCMKDFTSRLRENVTAGTLKLQPFDGMSQLLYHHGV